MAKAQLSATVSAAAEDSVNGLLLSPTTYRVFKGIPDQWWDEREVKAEISTVQALTLTDVARRIQNLVKMKLVERRRRDTIEPFTEIRRVGK